MWTRAPKGGPRNTSKPQDDLTPVESEASSMADLSFHSLDGDSNEENAYDSLTSHTTVSSSTSADFQSTETNSPIPDSITESQFSTVMPYQEDSGQTSTEVFTGSFRYRTTPQANNFLNPVIFLRHQKLMKHPHHLLFQGEALEVQEEHLLYALEGLLPIALEFPACLTVLYIDKPYLCQAYPLYLD